jgi:hypothetical protein
MAISCKAREQFEYVSLHWLTIRTMKRETYTFDYLFYTDAKKQAALTGELFVVNYRAIESELLEELFRGNK